MSTIKELDFNTEIATLGKAKVETTLKNRRFVDDGDPITLWMSSEELSELDSNTLPMQFEKAGPRKRLYFDPSKTKCAIVSCGGLLSRPERRHTFHRHAGSLSL